MIQGKHRVLLGFDGFVDEIVHVVDVRSDAEHYTRLETIGAYTDRISAAAGFSTNIEYVTVQNKLGGNGAIMADSLIALGESVSYIGAVQPGSAAVCDAFNERCIRSVPLCAPAHTDAVEFHDGKLIISKTAVFSEITFARILECIGLSGYIELCRENGCIMFGNWTMLPYMNDILEAFLDRVAPSLSKDTWMFFDLADPSKRTAEDIRKVLALIERFGSRFPTVLGMNLREAQQLVAALGINGQLALRELCTYLYDKLKIHTVFIHPLDKACAMSNGVYAEVPGPYCEKPVLVTGAGDNFNAGFCQGLLNGETLAQCLTRGVCTSGFYVRQGRSPNSQELSAFMSRFQSGRVD